MATTITSRNFDRYNNRYEIAKATPKGAPIQRKSNKDVTRSVVDTRFTTKYIECTAFVKFPMVQKAGGFTTVQRKDGGYDIVGRRTRQRIPFTMVAKNFRRDCEHIFQLVIKKYSDGTVNKFWFLKNAEAAQ